MKKSLMLLSALFCAIMFFTSIGGAFATWYLAEEQSSDVQTSKDVVLSEFVWAPEEILPITPGQNYLDLHESILYNNKNGLNSSKDALERAVIKEGLLHNSHNIQGGNLKHLFISEACRELEFVLECVNQNEFHLYMYKKSDVQNGTVGVTKIQVYMSILTKKNDKWYGDESQFGYAVIQYLPDSNIISIDVDTWTH